VGTARAGQVAALEGRRREKDSLPRDAADPAFGRGGGGPNLEHHGEALRDLQAAIRLLRERLPATLDSSGEALEAAVGADRWADVPPLLLALVPRVQGVTVAQATRDADWWCGALRALRKEIGDRR
jgi:hypothetical protein